MTQKNGAAAKTRKETTSRAGEEENPLKHARRLAAFIIWKTEGNAAAARALARLVHMISEAKAPADADLAAWAQRGAFAESDENNDALREFVKEAERGAFALRWDNGQSFDA